MKWRGGSGWSGVGKADTELLCTTTGLDAREADRVMTKRSICRSGKFHGLGNPLAVASRNVLRAVQDATHLPGCYSRLYHRWREGLNQLSSLLKLTVLGHRSALMSACQRLLRGQENTPATRHMMQVNLLCIF